MSSRNLLLHAQHLLRSGDSKSARECYSMALLRSHTDDIGATFLAHMRLAQIDSEANSFSARQHLQVAWDLRDRLPQTISVQDIPLARIFRSVGKRLAAMCAEAGLWHQQTEVLRGLVELGARDCATSCVEFGILGESRRFAAGKNVGNTPYSPTGRAGARAFVCDDCGLETIKEEQVEDQAKDEGILEGRRDGFDVISEHKNMSKDEDRNGGERFCHKCVEAFEKAVAQGARHDGTPCASCEDRTQPVAMDSDGRWYCEACFEEFYEEREKELEKNDNGEKLHNQARETDDQPTRPTD